MNITNLEDLDRAVAFKTAAVRDLAWVMMSPSMITAPIGNSNLVSDDWCQKTFCEHLEKLRQLDENPQQLLDYLSGLKNHRLGFYFEMLLAFWLECILRTHPFKKNVAVFQQIKNSGRRTMGEFDFLFGQKNLPNLCHWEVTVKFYLCHEGERGDLRWRGPAGKDRLDIKLARIFEHQLKLAETTEGHSAIENISSLPVKPQAFIKGYLFYPATWEESDSVGCRSLKLYSSFETSAEHLSGWWLRYGEVIFPKRFTSSRWFVLPKSRWLSSACCADAESDTLLDDNGLAENCARHFDISTTSLLLAEMQHRVDGWFEVWRGFVVDANWPNSGK